ncbi:MAG: heavy metal sensor histidine kinase [Gemmatimonadota bacterium]|nr:heavy metal sensor histidine kinase [Gemmatimonadota bacterium]
MRFAHRWSLAARLMVWYAVTAFLLVAAAAFVQYRTLVTSLAAEDDQQLAERLDAARIIASTTTRATATGRATRATGAAALSAHDGVGEMDVGVRILTETCRPVYLVRSIPAQLPPTDCTGRPDGGISYRDWRSPMWHNWRVASAHLAGPNGGWIEVTLDRSKDDGVLAAYQAELALVLVVALLAAAVLGYWIARRGLRPLAALSERMTRVDARSLDQRLGTKHAPTEIATLITSFDEMLDRLEAAFGALSKLSVELAHEFRTPLHVLRQQSEIALGRARSVEEYRDTLASGLEELDRLARMVDDMLFLARTEDPRSSINRQPLAVASELTDVAEYLDAVAAESVIVLSADAPPELTVVADRMLVRRALVNIVTNALRYTPADGHVRLTACAMDASVVLCVEDTGVGIPEDALPRVFDRYFRAPNPPGVNSSGSGLGLAIVRGIMHLHGGTAAVSSTLGSGTCVTLTFPDGVTAGEAEPEVSNLTKL